MISVDEALRLVLKLAPAPRSETVPLSRARGRALLEPAVARLTQPPFDASAMDGYALRRADIDRPLTVIGTSAAGHPWTGEARAGTAVRIFTGAPVPKGFDHVELQENVARDGDAIHIETASRISNIRMKGNDFSSSDKVFPGRRLNAPDIGLLAAMNIPEVTVATRPRVAILAGGDELVRPGTPVEPGQIVSSNDLAIAALVEEAGGIAKILPLARDTEESLRAAFDAAADAELLITIGGASVGDHDLIAKVAADAGIERAFHKVAMRPGKPLMAGRMASTAMLGLPGNPVSAIVCGMIFMQPLIRAMQGLSGIVPLEIAHLDKPLPPEGPRQHYLRARLTIADGVLTATPFDDQDSARLSLMSQADALIQRPAGDPARDRGAQVDIVRIAR